ncbi:phosphatidylinositol-glycan biosynthesis class F protein [Diabrotica virgifera virgifera]|uniref:Phosphatidylinositol-glycan biosynthesis class F protein n=1 Tax=Diabrotica virgifera virgifera TaxID=50390 RepID=A0A6P7G0F8_DIAVI|nr:phosphatidylinositol-glycan biosynthesis class F protein [Diabrotica virgifera virgifera]
MDVSQDTHRLLICNNILTCLYLPVITLALNFSGNLYNIGKKVTYVEYALALAEILKYLRFYFVHKSVKRKLSIGNIIKSIITCALMLVIFYVGAILFGAPFLSEHYETLFFATLMTVLTTIPICLHLDHDNVYNLFSSLLDFDGNKLQEHFLINIRFTVFGAWLGAVLIPLDWNRPYQDWPIPCCYGAVAGCFVGNLYTVVQYYNYGYTYKKKGKFGL